MKTCPYCKNPIKEFWSYCRNCNKPLIANLEDALDRNVRFTYGEPELYHLDLEEESDAYDDIIKDEEIDQKIKKIDSTLESKEVLGEPIPGSLLLEKSSLYYKKRDTSRAMKNLELALNNFKEENDLLNVAICHNELGIIQEDIGFFDQAIYHFNNALEILKELNDRSKRIKVLNNLGNVYFLIKDLEQSYNYYQEAYQLSQQENLIFEEVKSSSNLVEVLYLLKDHDRIKRILAKNLEFFKDNEDIYGTIQTEIKYGKLYYIIGEDYNESHQHLTKALELIDGVKENVTFFIRAKLEWECFLYLGHLYRIWDNLTKAENLFLQSLEAVRIFELRDNIKEGEILENLAELYISKGDIGRAIEYYDLSCEIFYKFGDNRKNAELKFKIGKIYLEFEEDTSKAINYIEEALNIYEDLEYTKECAIIYHKLGDIYLLKGITERAISNFESAKDYYQNIHDEYSANLLDEKIKSLRN
ncbi:MAG: tetratricopeptide repeat protein [Candidatus Lokiarchaeota archaeon]|nr:tetratricopeptide repeat protein [Candidatus Lokiarchaeota archaeon]